jgi:hypothetical protein
MDFRGHIAVGLGSLIPRTIELVTGVPLTPAGKPDKRALTALGVDRPAPAPATPAAAETSPRT